MNEINDKIFGILNNEESLWMCSYEIELFNQLCTVGLIVYCYEDDGSDITDNQRETFSRFELNKKNILKHVELSLMEYCRKEAEVIETGNIENVTSLKYIKIIHTENGEDRKIGFIFDTSFDPELGVGILISNERVVEIGVQDIVL